MSVEEYQRLLAARQHNDLRERAARAQRNIHGELPRPLRANTPGWRWMRRTQLEDGPADAWVNPELGLFVLSATEIAEQNPPGSGLAAPHYHVSATWRAGLPRTCTDEEMERVREAFGLAGAEEDNHGQGIARHLWILCGREKEPTCACKQDEQRTVEGDRVRYDVEGAGGAP